MVTITEAATLPVRRAFCVARTLPLVDQSVSAVFST